MNEFQLLSQLDELNALKEAKSAFDLAVPQPFLSPQDSGVAVPTWGKAIIPVNRTTDGGGGTAPELILVECVIGVNVGGSFVPMLAKVVGPATSI